MYTANEAGQDMRLSGVVSTANIAAIADGDWALIAPYGDHPSPDGSYTQHFDFGQALKVVATWNSIAGQAARYFKNAVHGRMKHGAAAPAWDGHPETDKVRWPKEKLLADITDIRAGAEGLEGRISWNAKGLDRRTRGPLFPSPLWWHMPPSGNPPMVYPELLESVGLVTTPNISAVPAWTANATLAGNPQAENKNQNPMNETQLNELRKALGLPENADPQACISRALSAQSTANAHAVLATANSTLVTEKADVETKLRTVTDQLSTANGERDALKTEKAGLISDRDALKTANASLLKGILDLGEKKGAITPAERPTFETRLSTANTADAAAAELLTRKAMNVTPVEINGKRVDLSTANARQSTLQSEVAKRMKADNSDYDTAYAAVQADPNFAGLFGAMADPTRKTA